MESQRFASKSALFLMIAVVLFSFGPYSKSINAGEVPQSGTGDKSQVVTAKEPFEDMFGKTRHRPAPLATIEHLAPADLYCIVMTDVHVGPRGQENWGVHNWRAEEAIRQVNALRPEFVIHAGDSMTAMMNWPDEEVDSLARYALEIFDKLTVPLYQVAGTHDIGWLWPHHHSKPHPAGTINLCTPESCKRYRSYFGKEYYIFEKKGCRFIVINDQMCNSGYSDDIKQMEWLEENLKKDTPSKLTFFIMHDPFFTRSPDEKRIGHGLEPLNLVSKYADRVDVIYTGHIHRDYANHYKGIYVHGLNSTTWNFPWLSATGSPWPMSTAAQFYDPYKLGYMVLRVRDGQFHESWVPLYWRVGEPPEELARICGGRLVARPASEAEDSVLGITAAPPTPLGPLAQGDFWSERNGDTVNDHWWRLAEKMGCKWVQAWPMPYQQDYWGDLKRALTVGRPRGVKIAVPLPANRNKMTAAWAKLKPHTEAISAVVVSNGKARLIPPTNKNTWLTGWIASGNPDDWAKACDEARKLVPKSTKVVLGRLPLVGPGCMDNIRKTAAAIQGKADALAVWTSTQEAPEKINDEIASAAKIARSHRLELWLDVAAWEEVQEPLRSVYFLRLLALCQAQKVKVFWWNGPYDKAGLLDGYFDPTPLYFAAQAWQSMVEGPTQPVKVEVGSRIQLGWKDRHGREYTVWWCSSDDLNVESTGDMQLPAGAMVADPLHGRLLQVDYSDVVPLCSWPIIARR